MSRGRRRSRRQHAGRSSKFRSSIQLLLSMLLLTPLLFSFAQMHRVFIEFVGGRGTLSEATHLPQLLRLDLWLHAPALHTVPGGLCFVQESIASRTSKVFPAGLGTITHTHLRSNYAKNHNIVYKYINHVIISFVCISFASIIIKLPVCLPTQFEFCISMTNVRPGGDVFCTKFIC